MDMGRLTHTNGKLSGTKTWFSLFASVTLFKYLVSGLTIFGLAFPILDLTQAGTLLVTVGGIYAARRYTDKSEPHRGEN